MWVGAVLVGSSGYRKPNKLYAWYNVVCLLNVKWFFLWHSFTSTTWWEPFWFDQITMEPINWHQNLIFIKFCLTNYYFVWANYFVLRNYYFVFSNYYFGFCLFNISKNRIHILFTQINILKKRNNNSQKRNNNTLKWNINSKKRNSILCKQKKKKKILTSVYLLRRLHCKKK